MERGLGQNILILQSGLRTKVKYYFVYQDNQLLLRNPSMSTKQKKFWSSKLDYSPPELNTLKNYSKIYKKIKKIFNLYPWSLHLL